MQPAAISSCDPNSRVFVIYNKNMQPAVISSCDHKRNVWVVVYGFSGNEEGGSQLICHHWYLPQNACLHYGVQWPHLACQSPSNRKCCNVSYTNYTGENHSVNQTFLDLKNVRPNKEMGGYLANLVSFLPMANRYFHPWLITLRNHTENCI